MLEITGDDVAELPEEDLRTLVALLCEAELRNRQLSASAVTWGGNQNAPDGGIDVRVALPQETLIDGFIPRPMTGLQVKKQNMPAGAVAGEMRPKGAIRQSIQELADVGGAYIIASSLGSVSDAALSERRRAMADAVSGIPNASKLLTDFYDRGRVATWVRDHPGLVPWVLAKAGRPLVGWQSYAAWANPGESLSAEYLTDDEARIRTGRHEDEPGLKAVDGINRIRAALRAPGKAVRIVGLSGVGKTRLVQALFDPRVGEQSLNRDWALYTNLSDGPAPPPIAMISNLLAAGTRAVLLVDNCPPDLHRRLAELSKTHDSRLSLITVEYDIREDQPEATEVFEIEPASTQMTEKLVQKRFPHLSQVDAQTIAEASGGNVRVAIALAGTIEPGESIAALTNEELFQRLFRQRHEPDQELMKATQACALLYSFEGEDISDAGELARLGGLVGQSSASLYARVAELKRRDLIQARSVWRAVLPHAIANRFAGLAFQNIPLSIIQAALVDGATDRVRKSFSRRLGYLHSEPGAVQVVRRLLGPGGILNDTAQLDQLRIEMLHNVAPVVPEEVLAALERAASGANQQAFVERRDAFVGLLRSIAYDPALFERCTRLLTLFAVEGGEDEEQGEASAVLVSLFFPYLSGTHASVEQRVQVLEQLLRSDEPNRHTVGLKALAAMLEAWHFTSSYDFQFGSRSRDHGYRPTLRQLRSWYAHVLEAAERLASYALPIAKEIPGVIAKKFRGLWRNGYVEDDLDRLSRVFASKGFWREGWIAARQTLQYDTAAMPPPRKARLIALEKELRPKDLLQKVRSVVLSGSSGRLELEDYEEEDADPEKAHHRSEALAVKLGQEVSADEAVFASLLSELVTGSGRLTSFGKGLAQGAKDRRKSWEALVKAFGTKEARNAQVLAGFLQGLADVEPSLAANVLDETIDRPILCQLFPMLQCQVPVDSAGVERLRRSLALGMAPVEAFRCVAWGKVHETMSAGDLRDLVQRIGGVNGGIAVGLEIIFYRLFGDRDAKRPHELEVVDAGRELLGKLKIVKGTAHEDYELGLVAEICLAGEAGGPTAKVLCETFKNGAARNRHYLHHYRDLFEGVCKAQPFIVLDSLFGANEAERRASLRVMEGLDDYGPNPLKAIVENDIIGWCSKDPATRYLTMASVVSYLKGKEDEARSEWSSIALKLLEYAPDRVAVARQFAQRFLPSSWTGSRAAIIEDRKALLVQLQQFPDRDMQEFVTAESERLSRAASEERKCEAALHRQRNERFE